jgi:2-polyprenyl-3-methyl-5-hydroxy-6-metoxy-1,4-benzoquinol methylase
LKLPRLAYNFEQDWILGHCRNKSVLHLGCAGDGTLRGGKEACLHYKLSKIASKLHGIELDAISLDKIKPWIPESSIPDIKYYIGDVEQISLLNITEKFDVIVAGSIIEHLSNPGLMLSGIRALCKPGAVLLISTPHTFGLLQFIRVAFLRNEAVHSEHTCWYSISTLTQAASRFGFEPFEWSTGYGWRPDSFTRRINVRLARLFFGAFPHLGGSLLAAFKLVD